MGKESLFATRRTGSTLNSHGIKMSVYAPHKPRFLVLELAAVIACLILTKLAFDPIAWRFAGPMSMACTITFIALLARMRSETWSDFGLRGLPGMKSKLWFLPQVLLGVIAIMGSGAVVTFGGDALGLWDVNATPAGVEDRFAGVTGNLPRYLMWMGLGIVSGGFGEEIFFRGYLMRRVEGILPASVLRPVLMVVLPALMFGAVHFYYQGLRGMLSIAAIGFAMGTLYLLYKRNLWPLIIAHAIVDSIGFTALYLGVEA
tara:strand:- start:35288 stop:36064 length:777 start_codon:yes stop_codon:yes gene_type:complete